MMLAGFIIYLSFLFILVKLPRRTALSLLGHDLLIDLLVTSLAILIHYGTFTGLLAATITGAMTSATTALLKRLFGYIKKGTYFPGWIDLNEPDGTRRAARGA